MNYIGIDVSKGKSNVTVITSDFEVKNFCFKHTTTGFNELNKFINQDSLIIFETTGVYSAQLTKFLRSKKANFFELNPLEANMRVSTLRRDKTDVKDSMKLALLGIEQVKKLKRKHYIASSYEPLRVLSRRYEELVRARTRIMNHLHSALELTFPELNSICSPIKSVISLQIIRMYAHPDFLIGLSLSKMTENVYKVVGKHITRKLVMSYCLKVWQAAKTSYPAVDASSLTVPIISQYCDEIEMYNQIITNLKYELIRHATNTKEYSIICSIPGTGRLNTALLLGFVGNLDRFNNYKQLNAFIGIDISRYHSGTLNKKDHINRRGNSYARLIEFEMIRSMLRNQKIIKNHLIDYYYKLKEPPYSKNDLVALIACANHLNRTIIKLVRTNQVYDYTKTSH